MQIQIIDVGTPNTHAAKNGRSYQSIEVTYKSNDGKVSSKKLMSFSNPTVFKTISGLSKGAAIDVVTTKDDAGYWQWTGINDGQSAPQATQGATPSSTPATTRVTGSNYETADERAARQRLIVRQSSLSAAVSILTVGAKTVDKTAVLNLASELTDWVFEVKQEETLSGIDSALAMADDIPY